MATGRGPVLRYGGAVVGVALATLVRRWLDPALGDQFAFITYFVAIAFAAWYGGLRASILALVLSWSAVPFLIMQPRGSLGREPDRRRSRQARFDHHLVKPVDHEALRDLLAWSPASPGPDHG